MKGSQQTYGMSIGFAADLMSRSRAYMSYPVACIREWIRPAVLLDQIMFFSNRDGVITGYITWAFLTGETGARLVNDDNFFLHLSEWNEGADLWIMDMVIVNGDVRKCINLARNSISEKHLVAKSIRRGPDGSVRKVVTWRR